MIQLTNKNSFLFRDTNGPKTTGARYSSFFNFFLAVFMIQN